MTIMRLVGPGIWGCVEWVEHFLPLKNWTEGAMDGVRFVSRATVALRLQTVEATGFEPILRGGNP